MEKVLKYKWYILAALAAVIAWQWKNIWSFFTKKKVML